MKKLFLFLVLFLFTFGANAQFKDSEKQYLKNAPYNENGGFENGKTKWYTYSDADQEIPEDMYGSPGGITTTLNSTNPIDGKRDLIIEKGIDSKRGKGLATTVTIPAGMQGQKLEICFQYRTSSGYADNDAIVYAYDITNSSLASTEPAPRDLKAYAASTGSATHCSYVQALSNSTQYRFGIHISTVNTTEYTITIDNFWISKVNQVNGAAVTATKDCTATGSWTTNTTYTCKYRRNGDRAFFDIKVATSGAPTSSGLNINLPFTIDTSKLTTGTDANSEIPGQTNIYDASGAYTSGRVFYLSPTSVSLKVFNVASTYPASATSISDAVPQTFASGDYVHTVFEVPIAGWEATGILGQDATTQVVGAYTNGSATTFSTTPTTLVPTTISKDSSGRMSAAGVYTIDISGWYIIGGTISTSTSTTYLTFGYIENGGAFTYLGGEQTTGTTFNTASGTTLQYLIANDTIAFQGAANTTVAADNQCNTYVIRMSGPANVAVSEWVGARAVLSASQTGINPNGSYVKINFNSVSTLNGFDTSGSFSTTGYKFTCQNYLKLRVSSRVMIASTNVLNTVYLLSIYKNGTQYSAGKHSILPATTEFSVDISDIVSCNQGDDIEIFLYGQGDNSTNTLTAVGGVSYGSYVTFEKVN